MSNIQSYNAMPVSLTESMNMAKMFAESGMFSDIKSAAQALVKIQAGAEMGIPPFASMSGVHIIQGKPTVGAGLMASRVKASGKYDYRVIEQSDKVCSVDFYQGKEKIGNSTFTLEDARKAGTKNIDKFPKNMLFARAISNGVKFYCPDVFAGPVYVPEEMETIDVKAEVVKEPVQEIAPISEDQINTILELCKSEYIFDKEKKMIMQNVRTYNSTKADVVINTLNNYIADRSPKPEVTEEMEAEEETGEAATDKQKELLWRFMQSSVIKGHEKESMKNDLPIMTKQVASSLIEYWKEEIEKRKAKPVAA